MQVLVPGDEPGTHNWLVLDPTPSRLAEDEAASLGWLGDWSEWGPALQRLFLEYNADDQLAALKAMWGHVASGNALHSLALLTGLLILGLWLGSLAITESGKDLAKRRLDASLAQCFAIRQRRLGPVRRSGKLRKDRGDFIVKFFQLLS